MSRIDRTRRATVDITELWVHIARGNYAAAERLVDRIDSTLRQLADNPLMGEAVDHIRSGLRRFPVGNYVLYYDPLSDGVRLQRVVHSARSLRNVFDDDDLVEGP